MTIDREFITPIGSSLSPNIAGKGRVIKRWKSEDVVFNLLKKFLIIIKILSFVGKVKISFLFIL